MTRPLSPSMPTDAQIARAIKIARQNDPTARIKKIGP